jgi:hypothetical protein
MGSGRGSWASQFPLFVSWRRLASGGAFGLMLAMNRILALRNAYGAVSFLSLVTVPLLL